VGIATEWFPPTKKNNTLRKFMFKYSNDESKDTYGCLAVLEFLFIPLYWLLGGLVTVHLWDWFVIPQFHVAHLSLLFAIGLNLFVSWMTFQPSQATTDEDYDKKIETLIAGHLMSWFLLGYFLVAGFIIHALIR
jgi:hypothetical protein